MYKVALCIVGMNLYIYGSYIDGLEKVQEKNSGGETEEASTTTTRSKTHIPEKYIF